MNILVHGTNWIGDAVMTIPAIRKLRSLFPDAKLTLQTRAWAEGIFRDSGLVDEIIKPRSLFEQIRSLRERRFDLAVIFPNSFESALAARLSGAKRRFGYASERRSFLLSDPVEIPAWKETRHEVYYYLELISAIEKSFFGRVSESEDLEPRLTISEKQRAGARDILLRHGVNPDSKTVALAPGSTNSRAKRWTPSAFARLNDRLQSESKLNVVLLGSEGDKEVARTVTDLAQHKPFDMTGETDIAGAAAILGAVDLLISNDMGLAHVAPAVGTKTLVIFGPTNPVTTRPFSDNASIISAGVECSPCMLRDCPIDHRCMTRISADEVFERAKALLNNEN